MKTHRWIPHVVTQAPTVQVGGLTGAPRTDPLVQASRRILILALVLGSLGADAAALSGYTSAAQANGHQSAGNIRLAATISPSIISTSTGSGTVSHPWMY
jgi:hypothetical protein